MLKAPILVLQILFHCQIGLTHLASINSKQKVLNLPCKLSQTFSNTAVRFLSITLTTWISISQNIRLKAQSQRNVKVYFCERQKQNPSHFFMKQIELKDTKTLLISDVTYGR